MQGNINETSTQGTCVRMIKTICGKPTANIILNGEKSSKIWKKIRKYTFIILI
jgi:hypothetical protein